MKVREALQSGTVDDIENAILRDALLTMTDGTARRNAGFLPDCDFPATVPVTKDGKGQTVRETIGFLSEPYFDSGLLAGTMDIDALVSRSRKAA